MRKRRKRLLGARRATPSRGNAARWENDVPLRSPWSVPPRGGIISRKIAGSKFFGAGLLWSLTRVFLISRSLPRQAGGVLVSFFAENSAHASGEAHAAFAEAIAEFVGCGESLLPALMAATVEQIELSRRRFFERRNVHAEQTDCTSLLPVLAEQHADLGEDFGIELRGFGERVRARDGGEVFVAQLELDRAGVQRMFAQAAGDHFAQTHQGGFELHGIGRVFVESVLVADGFRVRMRADFRVEPAAGILAAGFSGEGKAPFAEMLLKNALIERGQIANLTDGHGVQILLHDFAHAGDVAHVERSQEFGFLAGNDPEHTVGFRFGGADLGDQARSADAD